MKRRTLLLGLLALAVPAASAAMQDERVLRTDIVTATFTGWERGDYLWAQLQSPAARPISAMPADDPIGAFLEAHSRPAAAALDRHRAHRHCPRPAADRDPAHRLRPRRPGSGRALVERASRPATGAPGCAAIDEAIE